MHIFYNPEKDTTLPPEESWHGIKVMRLKEGSKAFVIDGNGNKHLVEVTKPHLKKCEYKILETNTQEKPKSYSHIALSPTKSMDRVEWFVEKATEIGVSEISFILCKNSERKVLKLERLQKIAISASKQSGRLFLPKINALTSFKEFILDREENIKLIAHLKDKCPFIGDIQKENSSCILIGPEGDFTKEEVDLALDKSFQPTSLGNTVLRTETAGVVASFSLNY